MGAQPTYSGSGASGSFPCNLANGTYSSTTDCGGLTAYKNENNVYVYLSGGTWYVTYNACGGLTLYTKTGGSTPDGNYVAGQAGCPGSFAIA